MPVWLAAYRYADQPYRILVNGLTGKVVGSRPYSWIKITLFVLVILATIIAAILLFTQMARGGDTRVSRDPTGRPEARQSREERWQLAICNRRLFV